MDNPQQFLNDIAANDTFQFLQGIKGENWANHRLCLYLALELTKDCIDPVLECGAGLGSTPYLRIYCIQNGKGFDSYESDMDWANKVGSQFVFDWNGTNIFDKNYSVSFVDAAPGEIRADMVRWLRTKSHIVVIHDSEKFGAGDYKLEEPFSEYKYRLDYNSTGGGAGATLVSDVIDISVFSGMTLGDFKFD